LTWAYFAICAVYLNRFIFSVVVDLADCVARGHKRCILEAKNLAGSFSDKQILKIIAGLVERHEWVLADCAYLEHLRKFTSSLHNFEYDRCDNHLGLVGRKRDYDFLLLLRAENTFKIIDLSKRFTKRLSRKI